MANSPTGQAPESPADRVAPETMIEQLQGRCAYLTDQRDEAEARFVKARDEASELEQEMADLRNELTGTKRRMGMAVRANELKWRWRAMYFFLVTFFVVTVWSVLTMG